VQTNTRSVKDRSLSLSTRGVSNKLPLLMSLGSPHKVVVCLYD